MPDLAPFRAVRYAPAAGDASALLAPPYDVIDASGARELRERDPHNCVRLILPVGGEERYEAAARLLAEWLRAGMLALDGAPAAYVYLQRFSAGPEERERLALLAALRLSALGAGEVLPHEETHSAAREDRLRLTLACRAQLSPVLLVARDPGGRLRTLLTEGAGRGSPVVDARTPDGIGHRMWRIPAGAASEALCRAAGAGPLLIADGHHRYETALEVRRRLPESEGAGRVLACVVSEADPGLLLLPTHRSVRRSPSAVWEAALEAAFILRPLSSRDPVAAATAAREAGGAALAFVAGAGGAALLYPRHPEGLPLEAGDGAGPRRDDPLGRMASAVFDRLVLRALFGLDPDAAARAGLLAYHRDPAAAVEDAGRGGAAFLLPPVPLEDVWQAAAAGLRLPPKTTYFHPKVPSGLLFRPL